MFVRRTLPCKLFFLNLGIIQITPATIRQAPISESFKNASTNYAISINVNLVFVFRKEQLLAIRKPVMIIPNLAIHLATADERSAFKVNAETHLQPVFCSKMKDEPAAEEGASEPEKKKDWMYQTGFSSSMQLMVIWRRLLRCIARIFAVKCSRLRGKRETLKQGLTAAILLILSFVLQLQRQLENE